MIQGWFNGWLDCIVGRPMAMVLLAEVMQVKSQGALEHVVIVIVRIPTHGSPLLPSFIISTCPSLHQPSIPGTCLSRPFSSVAHCPPFILLPYHIPPPQPHKAMRITTARTYLLANLRLRTGPSWLQQRYTARAERNNRDLIRDQHLACRLHRTVWPLALAMMG